MVSGGSYIAGAERKIFFKKGRSNSECVLVVWFMLFHSSGDHHRGKHKWHARVNDAMFRKITAERMLEVCEEFEIVCWKSESVNKGQSA